MMFKTFTEYNSSEKLDAKLNEFAKNNIIESFSYSVATTGTDARIYSVLVQYRKKPLRAEYNREKFEGPYPR